MSQVRELSRRPLMRLEKAEGDVAEAVKASKRQKELAVRGKYAEDKVRDELRAASERRADFDYERNYDARSSMGRIPRRAGDFTYYDAGTHGVIEVKQLAHDFRLPRKNFNPDKFGIIQKRRLAGGRIVVVVFHSTTRLWRVPPWDFFYEQRGATSWDLSEFKTFAKASAALYFAGLPTL